ncbi:group 1 glycosyl transferase [Klebsiella pneumoniae]|uniref:Group 1 glycosyl transferase n=1 Tax=Klebsiella pneumoniae TaxID=573 RepID=A0A447RKR3_KLEPN|nr:group 1 glycosyl transferase [Klebsiella pneumoniae]
MQFSLDGQEKLERIKKCNENEVQKEKINILFVGRFDKQKGV